MVILSLVSAFYLGCIASVNVYQGGDDVLRVDRQVVIPYVNCSNSGGRITHITASLSLNNNGSEYPSFQVWRPISGEPSVYERIGDEIVLEDSEVRAMDGYWLAEIVFSDSEKIEFKSGDVIGCYHPSNVRYQVNTISGNGSSVHDCDGGMVNTSYSYINSTSVNTSSGDCNTSRQQPLIQMLFGKLLITYTSIKPYFKGCMVVIIKYCPSVLDTENH